MPAPDLEAEMHMILHDLNAGDPQESIVRAQAMMGAATGFLTRIAGHAVVAAQLRADADTVASYAPQPGEPRSLSGALN